MLKKWWKKTTEDKVIDLISYLICIIVLFVMIYPFYYILIISFNEGTDSALGGIYWWPRRFTLENYSEFFAEIKWLKAMGVTLLRTILGTVIGVLFTALVSYGLSFKELYGRKVYMTIIIISMYFSGGLIPYYTLLKGLHLLDSFWVYVIPGAINTFFLMVGLSFFSDIPPTLRESAKIDGASEFTVFRKIIFPLCKPYLATMALFVGVGHWNNWYDSTFFVKTKNLRTLPYLMMEVINTVAASKSAAAAGYVDTTTRTSLSVQSATMIITVAPILCIYPFLQKYLVTGIMSGSVKE